MSRTRRLKVNASRSICLWLGVCVDVCYAWQRDALFIRYFREVVAVRFQCDVRGILGGADRANSKSAIRL